MTAPDGTPCARTDCTGTLEDGYCDECGYPPAPPPATRAAGDSGPATVASGSGSTGSRPSRRTSSPTTTGRTRSRLGGGLVEVPPVPPRDPAAAVLADPRVEENKRFCGRTGCEKPVGRSRAGIPGREEGFCPHCGAAYSFRPKLAPGDLVEGQYEVQGCLAHGGLGWIYLALDRKVENHPVVLKGLLNSGDPDARRAAQAELRFLARVSHPNIVTVHNFATHPDERGTPVGYIVMEYVGGVSLKQLLEQRRRPDGGWDPLPASLVIAYLLEMLPALGYLHEQGLVYCDFKPENVIQYDRQLKLIDLGAVIRTDDLKSPVYGTVGYQAPEIASDGPSPASDLHTVGRSLAVLALGMPPTTGGQPTPLPDPSGHPVLSEHESLDRLLRRATDPDPLRRFGSSDEMSDQLTGVLREVLAAETGQPHPGPSTLFGPMRGVFASGLLGSPDQPGRPDPARVAELLPLPLVDTGDPAAGLLATAGAAGPDEVHALLATGPQTSLELRLRLVRAYLEAANPDAATKTLDELAEERLEDWRLDWWRAVAALVAGRPAEAARRFDVVYSTLPGEPAPKLALAAASECSDSDQVAARYYTVLARTDPGLVDASFGLARVRLRAGERAAAIEALDGVPSGSSEYTTAQLSAVRVRLRDTGIGADELSAAAGRLDGLPLDPATEQDIRAALLERAVTEAGSNGGTPANAPALFGCRWRERDLRFALERCLRAGARLTPDRTRRVAMVDRANAVHPRTWT
ncbi:serine/threonine-protein kinase [Pseudonocardia acaciae]|uniref:serine/threonine-protein kinase n=1 Tax=Pseudonocardia acaciae TaxID=551276 RepID=UPI00048FBCCB|nr:serine/threonine-protein kinase [Pseudonocardia acaciae]